jgi:integrase
MARRKHQDGCLFIRGKKRKMWVARWREDVMQPDNTIGRVMRSEVLGQVTKSFNRSAALNLLEEKLRPVNQGRQKPQSNVSFEQFVREQWERAVVPTMKPSSARYYGIQVRCHLLPVFGPQRLSAISKESVQLFLIGKRRDGLSGSSVHGIRTALGKILQVAVEWGYLEQNVARGIRLGDRSPKTERLYLTPPEVSRLVPALPEPVRTLVIGAVLTGLRIGELLALRWKSLDLIRGTIQVRETFSEGVFGSPKTKCSRRDIPMSPPVREALLAQRARVLQTGPDDLVFTCRNQTPLNPKNLLRRVVQPTCGRLGLPIITWHSFRHTHATLLGEVGESIKTAQALLGHSSLETTLNVYTHAIPESQRRAVGKVAKILFPNVPKFAQTVQSEKVN